MPKILGVDIAGIAAKALGSKLLPVTLTVVTPGTRNTADLTAGTGPTTVDYACRGLIEDYKAGAVDGTQIQFGDRKVLILGKTINAGNTAPKPGDRVTIEGRTYTIVPKGVGRDPAAATYSCQVRG